MLKSFSFKKISYLGLVSSIFLFSAGCRTAQNCIGNSPLTIMVESTSQLLNNPELTDIYKNYLPSNNPELSYKFETKKSRTKFFLNPRLSFKNNLDYGMTAGFEIKY